MTTQEAIEQSKQAEQRAANAVGSNDLVAVAYGGGTNSTAMLCGFRERDIKPMLITFADTGAEMPHTYEHLEVMKGKVREWWGMEIVTVRKLYQGKFEGINGECLRAGRMPAIAYGMRACSVKYKTDPQSKEVKRRMKGYGLNHCIRAIGFGADEGHRIKGSTDEWATNWYPLVNWQWRRRECVEAIARHGIQQPGKSACYFCPASKTSEVIRLAKEHPELMNEALEIEANAQPNHRTKVGLGGPQNLWSEWLAMDEQQLKLYLTLDLEPLHAPCGCVDG